jgi:hypothetical protein
MGARCVAHVDAGRLVVQQAALAAAALPASGLDKTFAADVSCFWTGDPVAQLEVLRRALRPGGRVWLLYGAGPADVDRVLLAVSGAF